MTKKYPKEIYVIRENPGTDDEFLNAADSIRTHANIDEDVKVARYVLKDIVTLITCVKTK